MTELMPSIGTALSMLVLLVFPQTKWFERLNTFKATDTLEELLDSEGIDY
jgi:hypothetical protein